MAIAICRNLKMVFNTDINIKKALSTENTFKKGAER